MNYPKIPLAQQIVQLVIAKGIKHVVISPGSRNAPLIIGFSASEEITTYSIVDERCASFFAMGMAQKLQEPVAVVCTSGSALLNYYPAIAEAYYSQVPLVVLSADRPKHLIDVGDGQTIRQENVFENHICYSANLTVATDPDSNNEAINTAINTAIIKKEPVHINIPFHEPLYDVQPTFTEPVTVIVPTVAKDTLAEQPFGELSDQWNRSKKRMVLIGVSPENQIDSRLLQFFAQDEATIVFTETTSNVHHDNFLPSIDKIIAPLTAQEFKELQPDLLITLGGFVVSKKIKAFLRKYQPKAHYHVGKTKAYDTFFCLSHHFNCSTGYFYNQFSENVGTIASNYQTNWLEVKATRAIQHKAYLAHQEFSDFIAFQSIISSLPHNIGLHLSNSSTIRYMQLFNQDPSITQYCNRGTSGIDGSTSTALGHAVVASNQQVLITGDLSFFYDSNALWNAYIPQSFRIIVINNNGGGIFRILPGQKNTASFETYFETKHTLTAQYLCAMYGFEYQKVDNLEDLEQTLKDFYAIADRPKLLEIHTPRIVNDKVLLEYFKGLS